MEEIHQVRVNIKKLRAVLRMVSEIQKRKFKLNALDNLFDDAGELRELQVDIKVLSGYQKQPSKIISRLKKKLEKTERRFNNEIPFYLTRLTKFEEKNLNDKIAWPKSVQLNQYFNNQIKAIAETDFSKRSSLHHFRMQLKKIMYAYNALPSTKRFAPGIKLQSVKEVQDKVGKWHDLYVAVELLKKHKLQKKKSFSHATIDEKKTFLDAITEVNQLFR